MTLGQLGENGAITHGNTGYTITYDAAGQRMTAASSLLDGSGNPDYNLERYRYVSGHSMTFYYRLIGAVILTSS